MAVDHQEYRPTDRLIQVPRPRRHYKAHISSHHWQLRSLISAPERNIVYYPRGQDIIRLNTTTREREIITSLSFEPRCLTANGGWLCCGGDHGSYTSIYVGTVEGDTEPSVQEADSRLPLPFLSRSGAIGDATSPATRDSRMQYPLFPSVKTLGREINNCITIWVPPANASSKVYTSPVAVVARNDSMVSIVNLDDSEVLDEILYPDYVNRAILSPDGHTLVAVCDDPFLYVHTRKPRSRPSRRNKACTSREGVWHESNCIQLPGQSSQDMSTMRGSFAACFSESGSYLAVATQYGIISIFDATMLDRSDVDALLQVFATFRAGSHDGAVRAMAFSPGTGDLLAWTEAVERVGVADLRDACVTRQSLTLDSRVKGVESVSVADLGDEARTSPTERAELPAGDGTPDYLGLDFERRNLQSLSRQMLDRQQAPLTNEELQVLQAHQLARHARDRAARALALTQDARFHVSQQRAARVAETQLARVTPTSGEDGDVERRAVLLRAREHMDRRWPRTTTNPDAVPLRTSTHSTHERLASFRAFIDRQNRERERRDGQAHVLSLAQARPDSSATPRRASMSAVLANLEIRPSDLAAAASENSTDVVDTMSNLRLATTGYGRDRAVNSVSDLRRQAASSTREHDRDNVEIWEDIEALYGRHFLDDERDPPRADTRLISASDLVPINDPPLGEGTLPFTFLGDEEDNLSGRARRIHAASRRSGAPPLTEREFAHRLRQPWRSSAAPDPAQSRRERETWIGEPSVRRSKGVDTTGICWSVDGQVLYVAGDDGIYEYQVNTAARMQFPSIQYR